MKGIYIMSIFGNLGRKMIAARQKQVNRYVNDSLLALDDKTLAEAGFDRKTLKRSSTPYFF